MASSNMVVLDLQPGCSLNAASMVLKAIGKAFPSATITTTNGTSRIPIDLTKRKKGT